MAGEEASRDSPEVKVDVKGHVDRGAADSFGVGGWVRLFDSGAIGGQLQQERPVKVDLGNLSRKEKPTMPGRWELNSDASHSTSTSTSTRTSSQNTSRDSPKNLIGSDKTNGYALQTNDQSLFPSQQHQAPDCDANCLMLSPHQPTFSFWDTSWRDEQYQDQDQDQNQSQNQIQDQAQSQRQSQSQHQHWHQHKEHEHLHQDQRQQFDQDEVPLTSNLQLQLHQQQQPRLRLRQGSLATGWRFPSMHSSQRSPTHTQQSTSESCRDHCVSPASYPHSPKSSTSPNLRQRRGLLQIYQNTDPLVNHRLISSDPVNSTRTLQAPQLSITHWQPPDLDPFSAQTTSPTTTTAEDSKQSAQLPTASPYSSPPIYYDDQVLNSRPHADETFTSRALVNSPCDAPSPRESLPLDDSRFDRCFPITPVSPAVAGPRWDSLPSPSRGSNSLIPPVAIGLATTANAPIIPDSTFPPSPLRSPKSPNFYAALHSHPFIPENQALDLDTDFTEFSRHEHTLPVKISGPSAIMYRPDSRQSERTAYSADNIEQPWKPSLTTLNRPEFPGNMTFRPGTARSAQSDSLRLESRTKASAGNPNSYTPYMPYSAAPKRQPSVGSNLSASTFTSATPSLQHKLSQDRLGLHRNVSQNVATGNIAGLPHTIHPQAPPRYYNRGPLALNQQSHVYEEEMRSSVRSQLTTSTAQETLFTEPERTSVMTKTSSVFSSNFRNTRQSSFFGPHLPSLDVRDSLSVDDVMGMYEHGFNDSDMDLARRMSGIEPERTEIPVFRLTPGRANDHDDSRPSSAVSHNSEAANRLLEAMNQPSPMPIPGRSFPLSGEGAVVLRDTNAFFRKSLASSLPKDMRLSFISTTSKMEQREDMDGADDAEIETDSTRHSRHDSGKMIEPRDDDSPLEDPEKSFQTLQAVANPTPLQVNGSLSPGNGSLSPRSIVAPSPPQSTPSVPIQGAAQPEDLDPSANDRYGFRKSNQYVTREQYDQWNGPYSDYLARRRKKWEAYLKENGLMTDQPNRFPQHSAKAKRFVRKGIPPDWRGAAWFYYAGGPKILANNQGVYDQLVKRSENGQLKDVCRDDIERDLYRTFPDNVRFRRSAVNPPPSTGSSPDERSTHSRNNSTQSANPQPRAPGSEPEIIAQLRRVLSAFAIFNPNIGYCQSLNFLGGMLLLFVETEEQAFWLLNIITRVYLPGTHEMSLEGSKVDLSVLMQELQDVLPNVWTKISDDGSGLGKKKPRRQRKGAVGAVTGENLPPVTLALTAWFMSCFIGTLPIETTLRVWDVFFYEGSKTLFRVALAIFKAGENEIKAISDPMEVFAVVQSLPRKMLDANGFMEIAFKKRSGLNHLTAEVIDERRAERKERLQVERKEAVAAAAGNPGIQTAATIAVSRTKNAPDLLSVDSGDSGVRRKHTLFGRRQKERGLSEV